MFRRTSKSHVCNVWFWIIHESQYTDFEKTFSVICKQKIEQIYMKKSRFILNTLTKNVFGTLLISSQSSRVCQSAVVLLKKRLYQNCFRFAQQFWSTQTQMHFASPLSFTLINTLHLLKCLNKPRATEGWISVHLELHTPNPFFNVNAMKSDLYQVLTFRPPRPQWFV